MEESAPPIPDELLPITNRWMDPHYGLRVEILQSAEDEQTEAEYTEEEEERLQAAIRMGLLGESGEAMGIATGVDGANVASASPAASKLEKELVKVVNERHKVLYAHDEDDEVVVDVNEAASASAADPEMYLNYGILPSANDMVKEIVTAVGGKARNKIALIDYQIATFRDLKTEVNRVEKDSVTRKKAGRRKNTRKKTTSSEATE